MRSSPFRLGLVGVPRRTGSDSVGPPTISSAGEPPRRRGVAGRALFGGPMSGIQDHISAAAAGTGVDDSPEVHRTKPADGEGELNGETRRTMDEFLDSMPITMYHVWIVFILGLANSSDAAEIFGRFSLCLPFCYHLSVSKTLTTFQSRARPQSIFQNESNVFHSPQDRLA